MNRSIVTLSLFLFAAACGPTTAPAPNPAGSSKLAETWHLATLPAESKSVLEVRKAAKAGDPVVVTGRAKDFVDGRAVFTVVDRSLKACNENPADSCKTPWDYCCIDSKELQKATVTVELREQGKPVPASARGFHGLDHLKEVVVKGAAEVDAQGNVVVVASGVHVK